ncbi:TPA: carbon-nitrogen hydrolase family protein [archaeon]|uniref:Carbon-nitrogen hydrolase family protein n=1 Tax=Candidatus Naiadarchaeum limnaeum TaxID=2756139 RepID=A0A832XGG7_9ARCH|nr:carbon-nitrogen hydrolase family protein [Candidatus Naiadarchaeales archaeon SRR2090153.bin1042]HIK00174.1 carbon-nitrogen hydrolase family protein [Candidatus Naiadarchaeum limnaeum]
MNEFKVALVQMDIKLADIAVNLKKAAELVAQASKQNADFVCLPEYLPTGWAPEQLSKLADPIPGRIAEKLSSIAEENSIHIVASIPERSNDKIYNTAVLINPSGDLLAKYRKIHMFMEEPSCVTRGNEYAVADTKFGKVGLMICYDAVFPEVARQLALNGADTVFMPSNWMDPFLPQWKLATSARAFDNQFWIVAANRIGKDNTFTYFGSSRIVNPYGNAVIECGNKEEVLTATIDKKASEGFKQIVNFLKDRQPEAYK